MLAHILAIAVALGGFVLFMAAFFFPEVHRKSDFLWSGVALFYALVLWICAGRITGGVLLGQTASVALLGWLGWETLNLRRATTAAEGKTVISPETREKINRLSPNTLFAPITNRFRKPTPSAAPVESVATLLDEPEPTNLESLADRVVPLPTVVETESSFAAPSPAVETESNIDSNPETSAESEASATLPAASRGAQSIAPPPEIPLETPSDGEETETLEVSTLTVEQITSVETGEVLSETVELAVETIEVNVEEAPTVSEVETSESFIPLEKESEVSLEESSEVEISESFIPLEKESEVSSEISFETPTVSEVEASESFIPLEKESEVSQEESSETSSTQAQATPPKPPTSDMVEAAQESKKNISSEPPTPISEFAPEVDLAPYADPNER